MTRVGARRTKYELGGKFASKFKVGGKFASMFELGGKFASKFIRVASKFGRFASKFRMSDFDQNGQIFYIISIFESLKE